MNSGSRNNGPNLALPWTLWCQRFPANRPRASVAAKTGHFSRGIRPECLADIDHVEAEIQSILGRQVVKTRESRTPEEPAWRGFLQSEDRGLTPKPRAAG